MSRIKRPLWLLVSPFALAPIALLAIGASEWLQLGSLLVMVGLGLLISRYYERFR